MLVPEDFLLRTRMFDSGFENACLRDAITNPDALVCVLEDCLSRGEADEREVPDLSLILPSLKTSIEMFQLKHRTFGSLFDRHHFIHLNPAVLHLAVYAHHAVACGLAPELFGDAAVEIGAAMAGDEFQILKADVLRRFASGQLLLSKSRPGQQKDQHRATYPHAISPRWTKNLPAVYAISRPTAGAIIRTWSINLANCSG